MTIALGLDRQTGGTRFRSLVSSRTLQMCAIATCAALLLGLAVSYVTLLSHGDAGVKQTDFMAYYSGARLVLEGHGGALYNFTALGQFERHLVYPLHVRNGVLPFVYPPYVALLLAPLAALPYGASYLVWTVLNCVLLAGVARAMQRYLGLGRRGSLLLWLATFSFLPVFVALAQGQTSILLLALLVVGFLALRTGQEEVVGACLAVALIKPPYVAPLILMLFMQRRWRALGTFAVGTAVLALLPLAVVGASADIAYVHTLLRAASWHAQFGYGAQWNHSLAGFDQLLLPAILASKVTLALDTAAVSAQLYLSWRHSDVERAYGLAAVVALLIGPHVLVHDLSLCLLPAAVVIRHRHQGRWSTSVLVAGYALFFVGLRLVTAIHVQLSVIALTGIAGWLVATKLEGRRRIAVGQRPPPDMSDPAKAEGSHA